MPEVDISFLDRRWKKDIKVSEIRQFIKFVLPLIPMQREFETLSITLANDDLLQKLNKEYRGIDKSTNVLSFPMDYPILGDIIISHERILAEALEQGKSFVNHLYHIVLHGLLHLFGYDHETNKDAKQMEDLEIEILNKRGIQNPYENN